ncbi:MAG: branched-chain amino acid aminotransferase, partial [Bdellovibrionales bacterium]
MTELIPIQKNSTPKVKPSPQQLGFGKYFSDHMYSVKYQSTKGWYSAQITPYAPLQIDPGASVLHYGQALFEGMKAFRQINGDCVLFRPQFNWKRLCEGADRLCMQAPPMEMMIEGVHQLVRLEKDWIPEEKGSSLYIRPTLIGTESFLGVRPSEEYLFFVICSPVGSYYTEGSAPIKIWVEDQYLRASPGGLGATKAGANYAASLKAAQLAKKKGYAQVLWQDVNHQYIEEVGTMNVFFVIGDEIITPELDGSILPGGVRDCAMTLLKDKGYRVSERKLAKQEIIDAHQSGQLKEAFGTGTAAVISPIGDLGSNTFNIKINDSKIGPVATWLY